MRRKATVTDPAELAEAEIGRLAGKLIRLFPAALFPTGVTPPVWLTGIGRDRDRFQLEEPVVFRVPGSDLLHDDVELLARLLHRLVHLANALADVLDCSAVHYHNEDFAELARIVGLSVGERHNARGFGFTSAGPKLQKTLAGIKVNREAFEPLVNWVSRKQKFGDWRCGRNIEPTPWISHEVAKLIRRPLSIYPRYRMKLQWLEEGSGRSVRVRDDHEAAAILWRILRRYDREALVVLSLDSRQRLIGYDIPNVGSWRQISLEPRTILLPALVLNARGIIVGHNHPGGNPQPSVEDGQFSRLVDQAANLLGLRLYSSLVVAGPGVWRRAR